MDHSRRVGFLERTDTALQVFESKRAAANRHHLLVRHWCVLGGDINIVELHRGIGNKAGYIDLMENNGLQSDLPTFMIASSTFPLLSTVNLACLLQTLGT